jgi:hypothetical protein
MEKGRPFFENASDEVEMLQEIFSITGTPGQARGPTRFLEPHEVPWGQRFGPAFRDLLYHLLVLDPKARDSAALARAEESEWFSLMEWRGDGSEDDDVSRPLALT